MHIWLLIIGAILVVFFVWYLAWSRVRQLYSAGNLRAIHGTARLFKIIAGLKAINKQADQDLLSNFWSEAEFPLREVIADNTEATRTELVELLNQAHAYTTNRELARSLIESRNLILEGI